MIEDKGNKILIYGIVIIIGLLFGFYFSKVYFIPSNNSNVEEQIQDYQQSNNKNIQYSNYNDIEPQCENSIQTCDYSSYESQISSLKKDLIDEQQENSQKQNEISSLNYELEEIKDELYQMNSKYLQTLNELMVTQSVLNKTLPYYERVIRGTSLKIYYTLLGDYDDYAEPEILEYLNLDKPTNPKDDYELWERGQKIYTWLSKNYRYCGDKGLKITTSYQSFQFFSPDELMMSDNSRCGDCDDFATLFAGLMYASGVPEDKVFVVCGGAGQENLNHCWNWLYTNDKLYTIDGVCSQTKIINNLFDRIIFDKDYYNLKTPYGDEFGNVGCFSEYNPKMFMTPSNYTDLNLE